MVTPSNKTRNPVITGLGLVCPVGLDVAQACASVRAGVSRFQENPNYYCLAADADLAEPEPLIWSPVPGIQALTGIDRMVELASLALGNLIQNAHLTREQMMQTSVFLVFPDEQGKTGQAMEIFAYLETQTGLVYRTGNAFFSTGRMGWFAALSQAHSRLSEGVTERVIVVAADSLLDNATLDQLDQDGRLKSDRNLDGLIPGEAAAAILLESRAAASARNVSFYTAIEGWGLAEEPHPFNSPGVSKADGFTSAVSACLGHLDDEEPITWLISDFNGESHRGREWGTCLPRLLSKLAITDAWHPAEYLGESGAASAAIATVLAAHALIKGFAPAERALIIGASNKSTRAAMLLARP